MILKFYKLTFILLSVSIWFNAFSFQISRASIRFEHLLVILFIIIDLCVRRYENIRWNYVLLYLAWFTIGVFSTYFGTKDILRGLWIQSQYIVGMILLFNRSFLFTRQKAVIIQAKIAILMCVIYIISFLFPLMGDLFRIVGDKNTFAGYSLEPNLLGSQALLLWILLYFQRDLLSRVEKLSLYLLPVIVFISLTRAVWLGFLCVCVLLILRKFRGLSMYYFVLVSISFPLFFEYINAKVTAVEDIYWNLNNLINLQSGTARYRQDVYSQALSEFSDTWLHFWFGHGFASFPEIHPLDSSGVSSAYLSNAFIGLLFEIGVIGTLIFILLIGVFVYGSPKRLEITLYTFVLTIVSLTTSPLWLIFPWLYLKILGASESNKV